MCGIFGRFAGGEGAGRVADVDVKLLAFLPRAVFAVYPDGFRKALTSLL